MIKISYLKTAVVAFVAYVGNDMRSNIGIADHAHTVVLLAQSPQSDARLFSAKHEIRMVLGHLQEVDVRKKKKTT